MLIKLFIYLIGTVGALYFGGALFAHFFADGMIFPKVPSSYTELPELVKLESAHGDAIAAAYLPAEDSKEVLIYSHGNGEDLGYIYGILEDFRMRGVSVLAYDYPGYGLSPGSPSEDGVYASAESAYLYATETLGYAADQITLYGRSLGSGPSTWLAARYPVKGMIIEGGFSSAFRVMTRIKLFPFDAFDNQAMLPATSCPVLLIHGEQDLTVPFAHALANQATLGSRAQTLWIDEAGHNNIVPVAEDLYWETVLPFIKADFTPSTL